MLDTGKSTVPAGASVSGASGPTSDQVTPSFNACSENRLNVSIPMPGLINTSSISVGRTTVFCAAANTQKRKKEKKKGRFLKFPSPLTSRRCLRVTGQTGLSVPAFDVNSRRLYQRLLHELWTNLPGEPCLWFRRRKIRTDTSNQTGFDASVSQSTG